MHSINKFFKCGRCVSGVSGGEGVLRVLEDPGPLRLRDALRSYSDIYKLISITIALGGQER